MKNIILAFILITNLSCTQKNSSIIGSWKSINSTDSNIGEIHTYLEFKDNKQGLISKVIDDKKK